MCGSRPFSVLVCPMWYLRVLAGGYGYRQILELVQNGADAILAAHEAGQPPEDGNQIHVLLRDSRLYVANTGAPLSEQRP